MIKHPRFITFIISDEYKTNVPILGILCKILLEAGTCFYLMQLQGAQDKSICWHICQSKSSKRSDTAKDNFPPKRKEPKPSQHTGNNCANQRTSTCSERLCLTNKQNMTEAKNETTRNRGTKNHTQAQTSNAILAKRARCSRAGVPASDPSACA